jgi:proteasome lid subunit RPN8/RPN11
MRPNERPWFPGRPDRLILPQDVRRRVIEHLSLSLPDEGVGLLSANATPSGLLGVDFYPGANADASAMRYTMDPADVQSALQEMERRRARLGAIVHSHPRTPATLSATDLAEANQPGVLCVIVGFEPVCVVRAWSIEFGLDGKAVRGCEVPVVDKDDGALS